MDNKRIAGLLEQRRSALVEYSIGQIKKSTVDNRFNFVRTPADLFELLRMDPLDSFAVQTTPVAEAVSCAQQFIHAAYRKLEPGYEEEEFSKGDLQTWELYSNYPDWAAVQMIGCYPENYINPYVRRRQTSLFKALADNLNQTRLSADTVLLALQDYLQEFEQICNLDVISGYVDGTSAAQADYYFIGRKRTSPYPYYWRRAEVVLAPDSTAINPAAWSEWQPVEIPTGERVLDIRPVFWGGRLCVVWAEWLDGVKSRQQNEFMAPKLDINLAFMMSNGHWSAPLSLYSAEQEKVFSGEARLIATLFADSQHPKGKLGVLLTNRNLVDDPAPAPDERLDVVVVRDVLLRPVVDYGGWLEALADYRFVTRDILQNPFSSQSTPGIVDTIEDEGPLTAFYSLQALVLRAGSEDILLVSGQCLPVPGSVDAPVATFDLTMANPASGDPAPATGSFSMGGGWRTSVLAVKRQAGGFTGPTTFTFGSAPATQAGRKQYVVTAPVVLGFAPPELDKANALGAQFLALKQAGLALKNVRLNSLFGPELVQRANVSIDALLDWDTQFLAEPPPTSGEVIEPKGAFDGANGLFFWELFFHLPHLVAIRLSAEDRYLEAQNWLHYLFAPQAAADNKTEPHKYDYWRCRPLITLGNTGCEAAAPTDPDAIGYSAPQHFQIVVYVDYVKNLIAWGDWHYRQLTRDSLVAAKLCYVQAEFLMGQAPSTQTVSRWEPKTLGELLDLSLSRPALEAFEQSFAFSLADVPSRAKEPPLLGLLANKPFQKPINEQLLALYAIPGSRLNNLRHNLTLDGKPMQIPFFSPPTDPNQLLRDLAAGGAGSPRPMGGRLVVVAYRWRVVFEAALRAAQTLQEFGSQVLRFLEQRDRAEQEEMQQNHLVELGAYARSVQEQTIAQMESTLSALGQSRSVAQERADTYALRYEENVTAAEYDVMNTLHLAKQLSITSTAIKGVGAALAVAPNIFGVANGGHRLEKIADAVVFGLDISAAVLQMDADKEATTEAYRRRRQDWDFQRQQALAEVRAIDEQIIAQTHAIEAAKVSLQQTLTANSQALVLYNFLKKRATGAELYGWLLGQLKALHYQAYDAVVSLCISAQASLSADTGDYDSSILLPQVWLDNRHGLTAGEHLRLYLLRMDAEYIQRYERRLELIKTVSLRQLFDDAVDRQVGFDDWASALLSLQDTGTLEFRLTQLLFDRDHPGHYCRQISSVEVDLPVLTGPFEDVRATLLQVSSMTATKASLRSVEYLHAPDNNPAPADVQVSLRSGQQIALSVGLADSGMTTMKPEEGLLNPFECTGVVSRWVLRFPWPKKPAQQAMLASLTDVIVRVRYTARDAEPTFTRRVMDMVTEAEASATTPGVANGVNRHE